ncbi:penicillin-binding protein activator [Magnetovibrio sp. PR-2]|uniref:penicillin-binding protein activator n=1 Tax=Magnetovibrio sp. PR-2 TaxID=3120356 RepID=UPI002FCE2FBA
MSRFLTLSCLVGLGLLTACAGGQQQVRQKPSPKPIVQKKAVTPAPKVSDTYRIALLLPLSGPSKELGQAALNGAMMGFYENHSPKELELELYDTRGTQDGARQAAHQALSDQANIIVGPIFSANVGEVADIVGPEGLSVLALSNDKLAARENVKVLGPHLEGEVEKLLQLAVSQRSNSVLLFAPQNGYGFRLEQEFGRLMEDNRDLVFNTVLFPDRASVDELTQLISETGSYEQRTSQLQDILDAFQTRFSRVQDASQALTYAVDRADFTQRWVERHPLTCELPKPSPEDERLTDAGTVEADGTFRLGGLPGPFVGGEQKIKTYTHSRICDIDVLEYAEDLARAYALKQEADMLADVERPLAEDSALEEPEELAPQTNEPAPLTPDYVFSQDELKALMDSVPDVPSAADLLAERLETELEDARFALLNDMAVCIGFLAEKNYDQDKGVDAMVRTLAKREVLGPAQFDTVILPLAGDQLRMVSSLFDFYHVGPPAVRFFGDSQWDKVERLHEEPSLRQAKWLSVSRAFSEQGHARFEASFQSPPSYISALAFDGVRLAFEAANPEQMRKAPPQADGYIMGESGAFRINEDGTNKRVISVRSLSGEELAKAKKKEPEASILKASGPQFGEDREMYLKRTCLGLY